MTEQGAAVGGPCSYLVTCKTTGESCSISNRNGVHVCTAARFQYSAAKHQRKWQEALAPFVLSSYNFSLSLFHLFLISIYVCISFSLLLFILVFSRLCPYFFRSVFPSSFCLSFFHSHISYVFFPPSFRCICLFLSRVFVVLFSLLLFILVLSLLSPYFFRSVFPSSFYRSCLYSHISYVFSSFFAISISFCPVFLWSYTLFLPPPPHLCVFHGLLHSLQLTSWCSI